MSSYRYFAAMLLGFDGLLSLVELEGFSPGRSDLCKGKIGEFLMVSTVVEEVHFLWI